MALSGALTAFNSEIGSCHQKALPQCEAVHFRGRSSVHQSLRIKTETPQKCASQRAAAIRSTVTLHFLGIVAQTPNC